MSDLVERLRAVESSDKGLYAGAVTTCWHRNPDGPEAADLIERQAKAIEQAAVWFEEYAFQHGCRATQTGDSGEQASRLDKAKRNKERAEYLRATLEASHD